MIQVENLIKKYGDTVIFNNASYTFPDRGIVCLLGASGCGKSTLLNMLAGFDSDYSGNITVGGVQLNGLSDDKLCAYRRDCIGFVFQNYHLLTGYTVLENILLPCELSNEEKHTNLQNAKSFLKTVKLSGKENEKIENLSGGQKQRVAIARALMGNPDIILADEPTGALDRSNSTEIMTLLKEIAKDKLVVVITHDQKICDFADEIISIENGIIAYKSATVQKDESSNKTIILKPSAKVSAFKRGAKNFRVHLKRYVAVSLAISISVLCFVLSLSSGNIMEQSIADFKAKNTAFNNGYVKSESGTDVFDLLKADERVENVYLQYKINDITLDFKGKNETMAEKYPMPKATESMSYGTMPKTGQNEIALSPSLAKKFMSNISDLVGKEITLIFDDKEYELTVSGIFNAGYDDFFISSDVEQKLYQNIKNDEYYSVNYDVKNFEDIVPVSQMLNYKNIASKNASKEVGALQSTFQSLSRLFLIISVLILTIGLFISVILLVKLQNSRYKELGLLSALGFNRSTIQKMIISENVILSTMAGIFNAVLIGCTYVIGLSFNLPINILGLQVGISILSTIILIVFIILFASHKLIHTEPAVALRK
ncbi:ATP-binding cassette domain-containing protein [Clostridium sp. UBA1056]|uniref:ABC transporter ATP-binding protein/permease n=1 Tax=unclassified Clostridium TaxID=2614128 RepID=UPI003217030B